ncbi:DUF6053 domain-containing protein [Lysobacter enzymogenes]|uniref:DUF6053 domain-containing protein n=1 Tax=Lysobacter enzymogenes TaxID=69 RepID=UPI003CCDE4BE
MRSWTGRSRSCRAKRHERRCTAFVGGPSGPTLFAQAGTKSVGPEGPPTTAGPACLESKTSGRRPSHSRRSGRS